MVKLFEEVVRIPSIQKHCGKGARSLDAVMCEFSPLCCFVGEAAMAKIYRESGLAVGTERDEEE
jgi:hypothetical protein